MEKFTDTKIYPFRRSLELWFHGFNVTRALWILWINHFIFI